MATVVSSAVSERLPQSGALAETTRRRRATGGPSDHTFAALVGRTFERLARERRLGEIYRRWFSRRLPTGEVLDLPMGAQLAELFRMLGAPD